MTLYSLFHFKCTFLTSSFFLDFAEDTDSILILNCIGVLEGEESRIDINISVCSSSWHNPEPTSPLRGLSPTLSHSWGCTYSLSPPEGDRLPNFQLARLPGRALDRDGCHWRSFWVVWHGEECTIQLCHFGLGTGIFRLPLAKKWKDWVRRSLVGFFVCLFPSSDFEIKVLLENFCK